MLILLQIAANICDVYTALLPQLRGYLFLLKFVDVCVMSLPDLDLTVEAGSRHVMTQLPSSYSCHTVGGCMHGMMSPI